MTVWQYSLGLGRSVRCETGRLPVSPILCTTRAFAAVPQYARSRRLSGPVLLPVLSAFHWNHGRVPGNPQRGEIGADRVGHVARREVRIPPGHVSNWSTPQGTPLIGGPQKLTPLDLPWVTMARRPALAAVHDHKRLGGYQGNRGGPPGGGRPSAA
jgi:hypothetical protein